MRLFSGSESLLGSYHSDGGSGGPGEGRLALTGLRQGHAGNKCPARGNAEGSGVGSTQQAADCSHTVS